MKLIYFAHIRLPTERAHGVQIMKMCEAFAEQGAEVELVVPNRYSAITEDSFAYYAVKPIFTITRIGGLGRSSGRLAYTWSLITFMIRAALYARKKKPEVIYGRDEGLLFFLSFFYRNLVWEAHGWKGNRRVARLLKKLDYIIVITEAAKRRFAASGVNVSKMLVAPDGIDDSFFQDKAGLSQARERFNISRDGCVAMYVGLLDAWKGYQTLIDAAPRLKEQGIRVVIAGGVEAQVRPLRKQYPDITFLGLTPYKVLPVLQAAADVLVVPNSARSVVSSEYTSPLKVFAHMASGRPLVVSDLPSLREVLDEDIAYFFTPDSPDSLAKTIGHAIASPGEAREKARKALIKATDYTWEKRARNILAFIHA